jgi:hypothetical protein
MEWFGEMGLLILESDDRLMKSNTNVLVVGVLLTLAHQQQWFKKY